MPTVPTGFCKIYPVVLYCIKMDGRAAVSYNKCCQSRLFVLYVACRNFDVLLTVQLSIILVTDQLNAQILVL